MQPEVNKLNIYIAGILQKFNNSFISSAGLKIYNLEFVFLGLSNWLLNTIQ